LFDFSQDFLKPSEAVLVRSFRTSRRNWNIWGGSP